MSTRHKNPVDAWLDRSSPTDDAQVDTDALSAGELHEIHEHSLAMDALALSLDPVEPPSGLRDRILASATPLSRFDRFAETVASLIDRSVESARAYLAQIDSPDAWEPGPLPNLRLFHLDGGPKTAGCIVGFVALQAGTFFPEHTHIGDESVFVLQGAIVDTDGTTYRRGDLVTMSADTTHHVRAADAYDAIYLAVVREGVQIGDQFFGPDHPDM